MSRFITVAVLFLSVAAFSTSAYTQFTPSGGSETNDIIHRLSLENFKKIRLLMAAIINYGGGENEFSTLVNGYAEATSLYFTKETDQSVKAYQKNEKDINNAAYALAQKYKARTQEIHKKMIEDNVRRNLKLSLAGKKPEPGVEKLVGEASESLRKANDLYERKRSVEAIAMFRLAKKKAIFYYDYHNEKLPEEFDRDRQDSESQIYKAKEKSN